MNSSLSVPGIITDIDGVLVRQKYAIPRADDGIRFLKKSLNMVDPERFGDVTDRLPFICLTNSGTGTERGKAEAISNVLQLDKAEERLDGREIIMNFTPIRPILEEYRDRLVLLGGLGNLGVLAQDFGLKKWITDEEYCILFPILLPYREPSLPPDEVKRLQKIVIERLELSEDESFEEPFQVHAIFMLNDPIKWDERVQIICDLLSTPDGKIAKAFPLIGPEEHIPVYCTNNDILFAGGFRLNRMTFGCFNETLKSIYRLIYKRELELNMYGKPQRATFEFAEKYLKELTKLQISNFYMIGDNPKSDIRGGNAAGWITILVKTGVFQQSEENPNDPEDPAKYVVDDFMAALKLICELEGIRHGLDK